MNTIPFLPTYDREFGTVAVPLCAPKPPHAIEGVATLDSADWRRVVRSYGIDGRTARQGRDKGRDAVRSRVMAATSPLSVPLAALVVGGVFAAHEEIAYVDGDFKNLRLSNLRILDRDTGDLVATGAERLATVSRAAA